MKRFLPGFFFLLSVFLIVSSGMAQNRSKPGGGIPDPQLSQRDNDFIDRQDKLFLDTVSSIVAHYPAVVHDSRERLMAKLLLDAVFHDLYAPARLPAQQFFHQQTDRAIAELEATRLKRGARVWKIYDMGFIVRTPSVTMAFDLVSGASSDVAAFALSPAQLDRLVGACDVLFISHKHRDHADKEVARRFLERKKPVVAPEQVWQNDPIANQLLHLERSAEKIQVVPLPNQRALQVIIYPGHQMRSTDNNVALVTTPEGLVIAHIGDQINEDDFMVDWSWIDQIADHHKVDILMPNAWTTDICRIVKGFNPRLVLPGHELELGHPVWDRLPYWGDDQYLQLNYAQLKASSTPVVPLIWGESYTYDPKKKKLK